MEMTNIPLLSRAGEWLYSLNKSMLPEPPSSFTEPSDVCFLGPNGEEDGQILCVDLPHGMAPTVGAWYLSPERLIAEGVVVCALCLLVLKVFLPKALATHSHVHIQHPTGVMTLTVWGVAMNFLYKSLGYPSKILMFLMPCNTQWLLCLILCWMVPSSKPMLQLVLVEILISYLSGAFMALASPDLDDITLPGELQFFFAHHIALPIIPIAYILNGSTTMRTSLQTHFYWWLVSCAYFGAFYFGPVTLIGIVSGLNLNYMLYPPPGQNMVSGPWFRIASSGLVAVSLAFSRIFGYLCERVYQSLIRLSKGGKLA